MSVSSNVLTFQLMSHGDSLLVQVASKTGEATAESPSLPETLLNQFAAYAPNDVPAPLLKSTGDALSHVLLAGNVRQLALNTLEDSRQNRQSTRFELRFDANQLALARFPWELITGAEDHFLVRDGQVDITRYINYPQSPPTFDSTLDDAPLLHIITQPPQLPMLSLDPLNIRNLETIEHATFEQFTLKSLLGQLWGLQFSGHAALRARCRQCDALNPPGAAACWRDDCSLADARLVAAFAFERNGDADWVSTNDFAEILFNANVQLTLLLSSEFSRTDDELVFNDLAPSLILAGVPAAIGMQYPISAGFANLFLNSFYAALLQKNDVSEALQLARRVTMRSTWYSPTLYLRHKKSAPSDEALATAYHTRIIDTAVPARAQVGVRFLVRLWIRRPETAPLSQTQLRAELDIPETVAIRTEDTEVDLKFEPVEGRKLRRGQVDVQLSSPDCDVSPPSRALFVDEDLDAPAAIFIVRASRVGPAPLNFSILQDGGQIATISHSVEIVPNQTTPVDTVQNLSHVLLFGSVSDLVVPNDVEKIKQLLLECHRHLARLREQQARLGDHTPYHIPPEIDATGAKIAELQIKLDALEQKSLSESPSLAMPAPASSPPKRADLQDQGEKETERQKGYDGETRSQSRSGDVWHESGEREDTGVFAPPTAQPNPEEKSEQPRAPTPPSVTSGTPPTSSADWSLPPVMTSPVYKEAPPESPKGCFSPASFDSLVWIVLAGVIVIVLLLVCIIAVVVFLIQ